MAESDLQTILISHDAWATRQLLEACKSLSDEQFNQRFEMGPGSLHDTVTHMLAAMVAWTQILAEQTPGPRLDQDGRRRTPAEMLGMLETIAGAFAAEAGRRPLEETVTRVREGKTYTFTRGAVLAHVATHGTHHRAQCLNMLRQLGVKPLPQSSAIEWVRAMDGAR